MDNRQKFFMVLCSFIAFSALWQAAHAITTNIAKTPRQFQLASENKIRQEYQERYRKAHRMRTSDSETNTEDTTTAPEKKPSPPAAASSQAETEATENSKPANEPTSKSSSPASGKKVTDEYGNSYTVYDD